MASRSRRARLTDAIEVHSFDYVPESERHGKTSQCFYMFFGINASMFTVVTGFVGITLGLSLWWTLVAVLVGNLLGALLGASHAAQGPRLGLPQMIQSRAQFGYYGALLPLAVSWIMYVAFFAVGITLAGQGFQAVLPWNLNAWMAVLTIPMLMIAIFGYTVVHRYQRIQTWVYIAIFLGLTVYLFIHGVPSENLQRGGFAHGPFLLTLSVAASYQLTSAPYVSDYTRYLPTAAASTAFWKTFLAFTICCIWLMSLGAGIGALAPESESLLLEIKNLVGPLGGIVTILIAVGTFVPNSTNLYSGTIATLSIASNFSDRVRSTRAVRAALCVVLAVLGLLLATAGSGSFMTSIVNYLGALLYMLIPWSVINLADYYLVRHGNYSVADFYDKRGPFGLVNRKAMVVYLIAFAIEIPFMNTSVYEGPVAKALDGGDIAWIVGAVVTLPLYLLVVRFGRPRRAAALAVEPVSLVAQTPAIEPVGR